MPNSYFSNKSFKEYSYRNPITFYKTEETSLFTMQINDIPVKREQMKSFQCRRPHKKMPPNNCIKRCEWSTGERWKMSKFSIHHSRNTEIWQYLIFKIMIQNIYRKNSILIPYQLKVKY